MKNKKCMVCGKSVSSTYYAYTRDNQNHKKIMGYYCGDDAHQFKDWLDDPGKYNSKFCDTCGKRITDCYYGYYFDEFDKIKIMGHYCSADVKILKQFFNNNKNKG